MAQAIAARPIAVCLTLTRAIGNAQTLDDIYRVALDALAQGLALSRAAILLFDADGVMRFKASRGLSEGYRKAVEGHTPWQPDTRDPQPVIVVDVTREPSIEPFLQTILDEGIAALTFIPLVSSDRVIGKFMVYSDLPRHLTEDELQLAGVIAAQVAFAVTRVRAEETARRAEETARRGVERLRFALEASSMGTWEWDLSSQSVQWSDNLEDLHGLAPGTFTQTFQSYEREIHPADRDRVLASARRAMEEGVPYDVEYRIVAPDGTVRWVEGKGRVEHENGRPVRMTGVCMLVTRRKEAELARLAAAEEASRLKDDFLGTLSHELRTPLNAIVGWVQMLQQGDVLSPDRVAHAIDVIGRNARLQTQLIEDMLDVTRFMAGKLEIERRPLLVPQLVEAVLAGLLPAAEAKRITLSREVSDHLPSIEGDPKRLHQVLSNIVSNAIKFTPERGQVRISCGVDQNDIVIDVHDSGAGIALDFLPFVFERFRQADRRLARKHGGLGLGLAIARHLVEQHGGQIRAHSDGPDRGSTFSIHLPIATGPRTHVAEPDVKTVADTQLDSQTVLIVDDDQDSRGLLAALLRRCGADVIECESTVSAVVALDSASSVNLIVADLGMPDVDGYALMEHVRHMSDGLSRVPAVAVSVYARPEDRSKALVAGYNGYCPKPLEVSDFLQTVEDVLKLTSTSPN